MNPLQRRVTDLENGLDELESAFKIIDNRMEECEKDIKKIYDCVMPLPPQIEMPKVIEFTEVLKSICILCKTERHIRSLCYEKKSSEYSLGKIVAVKVIRDLTGMGLRESKEIVDKVWETL